MGADIVGEGPFQRTTNPKFQPPFSETLFLDYDVFFLIVFCCLAKFWFVCSKVLAFDTLITDKAFKGRFANLMP